MTLIVALALCTACVTTAREAPKDVRIQGEWSLDAAASDNAAAKIDKVVATLEAKMRARRASRRLAPPASSTASAPDTAGGEGANPSDGDDDEFDLDTPGANGGRREPFVDFKQLKQRLQSAFSTPPRLKIEVNSDLVRITPLDLPGREYRLQETFSRIDEYGAGTIDSSWSGQVFVLRARYTNRVTRIERYAFDARDGKLIITRELTDPVAGQLTLRSVYLRD